MRIKELISKLKMILGDIRSKKAKQTDSNFIIPDSTEMEREILISENIGKESNYTFNNCNFETYKEMVDYKNLKKYIDSLYEEQEAKKKNKKAGQ